MRSSPKIILGIVSYFILFQLLLLSGCKIDRQSEIEQDSVEKDLPPISVPSFNADSAYYYIQRQVAFGPRIPNMPAHSQTADFLISELGNFTQEVMVQEFQSKAYDGTILNLKNIIASFNTEKSRRILLAAHWDTRPIADKDPVEPESTFDGANDGGSGVGVLLEISRILSHTPPVNVGIDIILFDGEDYGEPDNYEGESIYSGQIEWCLGSQYWSKNKHKRNYMAYYGILLDMVGASGARFYMEGGSMQFAKKIVQKVWNAGKEIGYDQYFVHRTSPGITDDHIFVNRDAKIPMINIVEYDPDSPDSYFGPYHHTRNDNMDLIDKQTLKAVGQTVLYVIFNE